MRESGDSGEEWTGPGSGLSTVELLLGFGTAQTDGRNAYRAGELLREFAVGREVLRVCEDRGIVAPTHRGAERVYSRRDRLRLRYALLCRSLGFSPAEARRIVDVYVKPSG